MKLRHSWLVVVAVIITMLVVPSLREQVQVLVNARSYYGAIGGVQEEGEVNPRDPLAAYRLRLPNFIKEQAANDPEMLLGAGLLVGHDETAKGFLRKAVGLGNAPAAWTVYAQLMVTALPEYASLVESGGDPADPQSTVDNKEVLQEQLAEGIPERLQPEEVAELLRVLQAWEAVDPDNALPYALAARAYTATGQMKETLACWEKAGQLPKVNFHEREQIWAITRLLMRMGMPGPEAVLHGNAVMSFAAYAHLRQGARVAQYEGGLARMQGRDAEALRWWRASYEIGHKLEVSSANEIGYLVGVALEGIGAAPAWKWYAAQSVGEQKEKAPLLGGYIYYGPYHDWYLAQVGSKEDTNLRDRLVQAKVRTMLMREYNESTLFYQLQLQWLLPYGLAFMSLVAAGLFFLFFLGVGSWKRREADAATKVRASGILLLALTAFAPLLAGLIYGLVKGEVSGSEENLLHQALSVGATVTIFATVFLPLIAAGSSRVTGYGIASAWRGNLRRVLPVLVALSMLAHLGFSIVTARQRADWVKERMRADFSEMNQLREHFGGKWEHPTIPPHAVRAAYPVLTDASFTPPSEPPPLAPTSSRRGTMRAFRRG